MKRDIKMNIKMNVSEEWTERHIITSTPKHHQCTALVFHSILLGFFSLQSLDREKSCKKTLILYQCTPRHNSPYKTQQTKPRVTSANKYKTKAQRACSRAVSHFNCLYNSDCFCYGKATDEKYQLLIFMSYYLNLHQDAGALLKMKMEKW